jgi:hypothetical protein
MMVAPVPNIDATTRREAHARALLDADALFAPDLTPDLIATLATELLAAALGDIAFLTLAERDGQIDPPMIAFVDPALRAHWQTIPDATAALLDAARRVDTSLLVGDVLAEGPPEHTWVQALDLRAWLSVPLRGRDGLLGTLGLARITTACTPHDLALVEQFARQVAMALDYARFDEMRLRHERANWSDRPSAASARSSWSSAARTPSSSPTSTIPTLSSVSASGPPGIPGHRARARARSAWSRRADRRRSSAMSMAGPTGLRRGCACRCAMKGRRSPS